MSMADCLSLNDINTYLSSTVYFKESYCINQCVQWILENDFKRVGLEFPDNHDDSPRVSKLIEKEVEFPLFILEDSNRACGDCCVDERASVPRNIEAVIHFGRTCLTPTESLRVLYVLRPYQLANPTKIVQKIFQDGPSKEEKLILVYDPLYAYIHEDLASVLKSKFGNLLASTLIPPHGSEIIHPEFTSIPLEKRLEISNFSTVVTPKETSKGWPFKSVTFNIRNVNLPQDHCLDDYNFVYVGTKNSSLTALQLKFSKQTFYYVDDTGQSLSASNSTKMVMNRSKKLEQIKEAKSIGILRTIVKGQNEIVTRLKKLINAAEKKYYCFFMGKINEAKIANIIGIDIYIYVACPESSLFDRIDNTYLYQRMVTPWEVEVALNPSSEWSLNFETNFREILHEEKFVRCIEEDCAIIHKEEDNPALTLSENTLPDTTIAERACGILSKFHTASEALTSLSWQGLNPEEETVLPIGTVVEGRKGIASEYTTESNEKR